jgi:predicted anti-sigma-YlaC factor YlaD
MTGEVKLDCRRVLEELSDYLDDQASADLVRAIRAHLKHCYRCAVVYDTSRRMLKLVGEVDPFEVPLASSARLYARLEKVMAGR